VWARRRDNIQGPRGAPRGGGAVMGQGGRGEPGGGRPARG
jgi:hypothetical protein